MYTLYIKHFKCALGGAGEACGQGEAGQAQGPGDFNDRPEDCSGGAHRVATGWCFFPWREDSVAVGGVMLFSVSLLFDQRVSEFVQGYSDQLPGALPVMCWVGGDGLRIV